MVAPTPNEFGKCVTAALFASFRAVVSICQRGDRVDGSSRPQLWQLYFWLSLGLAVQLVEQTFALV